MEAEAGKIITTTIAKIIKTIVTSSENKNSIEAETGKDMEKQ